MLILPSSAFRIRPILLRARPSRAFHGAYQRALNHLHVRVLISHALSQRELLLGQKLH